MRMAIAFDTWRAAKCQTKFRQNRLRNTVGRISNLKMSSAFGAWVEFTTDRQAIALGCRQVLTKAVCQLSRYDRLLTHQESGLTGQ